MKVFKTQGHGKSIPIYDPGRPPFLLIPKAQITMQGIQVPCSSTSTIYPQSRLSELFDHIFAGYIFLCLIDVHAKITLLGFCQVLLASGQIESIQIYCQDDSYDYPLFPDPPKQDQQCELHVLTSHTVYDLKVNYVM